MRPHSGRRMAKRSLNGPVNKAYHRIGIIPDRERQERQRATMEYDFDAIHDRRATNCIKYDAGMIRKGRDDLLPLWVADMDFALPEDVLEDIRAVVDHGIFGYGFASNPYFDAVRSWYRQRFGWETKREWIVQTPGIVFALGVAVQAFSEPGEAVLIQQPVYYPFASIVENNGRTLVNNELVYENGTYHIDFEDFEQKIKDNHVKVFILCNPHNPVGRVWNPEELTRMGEICGRYEVKVVADEIHSDFVYPGHKHTVFTTLDESFADFTIVCTSPSKTFNLAGLQLANTFIPNAGLRTRFSSVLSALGYKDVNNIALAAAESVYTKGGPWHDQLSRYLFDNLAWVRDFLESRIPEIKLIEPEGTYLIWLDCRGLGLPHDEIDRFVTDKAHLWLDAGNLFGTQSLYFERVNIACPRPTLEQAFTQLETAVSSLRGR